MSGTVTASAVINFEQEIMKVIVGTKAHLGDMEVRDELMETAPSYIARMASGVREVVVSVRTSNDLWSSELEDAVRAELATHRSNNGASVRLKVVRT